MKLLILLCAQSWLFFLVNSFEQLVKPGYTRAESSSVDYGGYPNKTVDGDLRQSRYFFCMHTAEGHREAWLRINLRKTYNINSVKFWYRNDSQRPGHNTRRIQGFNIRLSNTTQTNHQDICYQDAGNKTLPPIIERECEGVAEFVWIYINKTFADGVFLEICEIQIFGCSYQDSDGNCVPCDQCKNDCNISGECDRQGCKKDGYRPPYCKACKNGLYGQNCSLPCGHCAKKATCDHVTGSCPSGYCEPGWKYTSDKRCDQECDDGTYGLYCTKTCSGHCAGGLSCNKGDGICLAGCSDGWRNPHCNEKCIEGFYGRNCMLPCGRCAKNATCDHVTGSCPSAYCEPGWKQTIYKRCDQECDDGSYGLYCSKSCSVHCAGGLSCNKGDGICLGGCSDGWRNPHCNETCNNGWYGRECQEPCGYCRGNKPCHYVNGSCFGLCEPGYHGQKCSDNVFSQHLANQREMIKLMRELLAYKTRKVKLRGNDASPTDFK